MPIGKIKFYSAERGYGFIYNESSKSDLFFHISQFVGPNPPSVGDMVSFIISQDERRGRSSALKVELIVNQSNQPNKKEVRTLDGFPCVRNNFISGFRVEKELGSISVGNGWFFTCYSVNEVRDALIESATSKGANAILNFTWHRERRTKSYRSKSFWGDGYVYRHENNDYFWGEGDAVKLVPEN